MLLQGTDILDVDDVVQFMTPVTLSVWAQRAGRAGRDGRPARAILLVEPSVAKDLPAKAPKPPERPRNITKGSSHLALTPGKVAADRLSLRTLNSHLKSIQAGPMIPTPQIKRAVIATLTVMTYKTLQ
jgi:superfamily II DNA/RNA helicase